MPKVKCDYCGIEFNKPVSKIGKHNFCCKDHYLKYHSREVPICTCEVCGKQFRGDKYNANRFCSRECYNQYHQIKNKERICPVCGKTFLAKQSEDIYCSWECYNKDRHMPKGSEHWNWKGGKYIEDLRHSTDYKKWRASVFQRDHYTCQCCGSKQKINAHHIYAYEYYPKLRYDIDNGITVCEECHIQIHQKYGYHSKEKMLIEKKEKEG